MSSQFRVNKSIKQTYKGGLHFTVSALLYE